MAIPIKRDFDLAQNELQNPVSQNLAGPPSNPKKGQWFFDTTDNIKKYWNGTKWVLEREYTEGNGIDITDGVVSIDNTVTGATHTKITYNAQGLITGGSDLTADDIPDISEDYVSTDLLGANNGVATLDNDGKVPSSQLPSYVDDVVDSYIVSGSTPLSAGWLAKTPSGSAFTPETDKIYVILTDGVYLNKTYRWSGTTYVEISASPAQATETQAGIAEIATQAEVTAGTDDQRIVTPLKLATYIAGMSKKITVTCPALTQSGGVVTWTITNTLGIADVLVQIYEVESNTEVLAEVIVTASTITIKMNSASNISAGAYKAVIIG